MRISDWSSDVCSSDLLEHARAAELAVHAGFADIRIGADADIEPAVGRGGEAFGPVAVGPLCGQIDDLRGLAAPLLLARDIGKGETRVRVRDIVRGAHHSHDTGPRERGDICITIVYMRRRVEGVSRV